LEPVVSRPNSGERAPRYLTKREHIRGGARFGSGSESARKEAPREPGAESRRRCAHAHKQRPGNRLRARRTRGSNPDSVGEAEHSVGLVAGNVTTRGRLSAKFSGAMLAATMRPPAETSPSVASAATRC